MGLFSSLRYRVTAMRLGLQIMGEGLGFKAPGLLSAISSLLQPRWGEPPKRSSKQWLELYGKNPRLRPVYKIAKDVAAAEWGLYVMRGKHKEQIQEHPLIDLLTRPNPKMSGYVLKYLTEVWLQLRGEAGWLIERNGLRVPGELWPVPPHWVTEIPSINKPFFVVQTPGGSIAKLDQKDIIWFTEPDPVNPYSRGLGNAEGIGDEVETDEYMAKWAKRFFFNDAKPPVVIQAPGADKPTADRLKEEWMERYAGYHNAHKPAVLPWDAKIQELGKGQKEMDFVESRKFLRDQANQHFFMPPEVMGIIENSNRACYSDDTECLTADGWRRHDELTLEDYIATWNPELERLEYHRPLRIVRYPYAGTMHHWKTKNVDVLVTPDHRMWTKTQFNGPFEIRRSYELFDKKLQQVWRLTGGGFAGAVDRVVIPIVPYIGKGKRGHEPEGDAYEIEAVIFARFLGYFISEGSFSDSRANEKTTHNSYGVRICQMPGPAAEEIERTLRALGMGEVCKTVRQSDELITWSISNKSLWHWLKDRVGSGAKNKRLPREVFEWNADAQAALLDALMLGDGSSRQQRTKSTAKFADRFYSTASAGLADDVQQLCIQLGLRASVRRSAYTTVLPSERPQEAEMYIVTISSKQFAYVTSSQIGQDKRAKMPPVKEVQYNGIVWCVEVPNHLFFTRRNGKVALHGNTIDAADYLHTKYVLKPCLDLIQEQIQIQLCPEFDEKLIFEFANPIPEDKEFALKQANDGLKGGSMTVDEWRQANGKDPLPGGRGQVLYIPFSAVVTPVNQLGGGGGDEKEEGGKASKGLSDEQKTAIWWVFEKSAVKLEANFKRVMKNFFQEQQDTVNAKLEQLLGDKSVRKDIDNIIEMLLAWAAENDKLKGVLKPAWLAGWKEGWKVVEGTFSLGINFDLLNPRFLFWLDEYGADQVKNINETTKDALRDELVEGLASGESVPKLRDRVSRVFSDAKGRRAETIARTESHNSVSAGTFETYRAADVEKKSWLSTRDMRTRDSHRAIDGEIRELHESFSNGLMYPGAPGPAKEVINCRCALLPYFEE